MTIKYAYIHPTTREYLYAQTREELQDALAQFAAQTYIDHYCNGQAYTIVEVQEDGAEKWFTPDGEQTLTGAQLAMKIKHMQTFIQAGKIPVTLLGGQ